MAKVQGLGRGLSSLIPKKNISGIKEPTFRIEEVGDVSFQSKSNVSGVAAKQPSSSSSVSGHEVKEVDITLVHPNAYQPRKYFHKNDLDTLANSIREYGILQPLTVTATEGDYYELIAGERRLQAAKQAGLHVVPVIIRSALNDQRRLELALIENIHRSDLNVVEEARAYKLLADEFELTQDAVAERVGKSRSAIANILRLLDLPIEVQRGLIEGIISEGHARVIVSLKGIENQLALYKMICDEKLSVRQTESRSKQTTSVKAHVRSGYQDPDIRAVQQRLEEALQTHIAIRHQKGNGTISIAFRSKEDLDTILSKMSSLS